MKFLASFLLILLSITLCLPLACADNNPLPQEDRALWALSLTTTKSFVTNQIKSLGTMFVASAAVGATASAIEKPNAAKICCSAILCATTVACIYPWRSNKKKHKQLRDETLSRFNISEEEKQRLRKRENVDLRIVTFLGAYAVSPLFFKQMADKNQTPPEDISTLAFQATFGLLAVGNLARKAWNLYR